eukprot:6214805-Pleurochrysis_carterae.AAC.5
MRRTARTHAGPARAAHTPDMARILAGFICAQMMCARPAAPSPHPFHRKLCRAYSASLAMASTVLAELHDQLDYKEEGSKEEDDENFAKSDGLMDLGEFAVALVRLAWHAYPSGNPVRIHAH